MKIDFFISNFSSGGAQKVVINLANTISKEYNSKVRILTLSKDGVFSQFVENTIKVKEFRANRMIFSLVELYRHFKNNSPDLLCSSLNYSNVIIIVSWLLAGRPCKLVVREDNVFSQKNYKIQHRYFEFIVLKALMRLLYPLASSLVVISNAVKKSLVDNGIHNKNLHVIHNPVNVNDLGDSNNIDIIESFKPYICAIGRLTYQKGFDNLVLAFAKISNSECKLLVIGEGEDLNSLRNMVINLGMEERITFLGYRENVMKILKSSEGFVLSSRWEGFGLVLVEALASGIPIVSTNCPGAPSEILLDGKLGILVPTDSVDGLTIGIDRMLSDTYFKSDELKALRINRAKDFTPEIISEAYMKNVFVTSKR
jgi:glycosyltransferase involved in cell wall biosynthesis